MRARKLGTAGSDLSLIRVGVCGWSVWVGGGRLRVGDGTSFL